MPRMTFILAVVYFALVEFVIVLYSPQGKMFFFPAVPAPEVCPLVLPVKNIPDYAGETIVYDVKMGAVKIGTSTFRHEQRAPYNGIDAQQIIFKTNVVQINDTETIWAGSEDFMPMHIEREVRMWPKYERITESYDQGNHTLDITKTAGGDRETTRIVRQGPIHNAILLPYQVRRIPDLVPGWTMKVTLPTQEFEITLKSLEEVTVPAGTFNAFYFASEPKRFEIWISADDLRIPVKIKGSSGLNYTMSMRSYSK